MTCCGVIPPDTPSLSLTPLTPLSVPDTPDTPLSPCPQVEVLVGKDKGKFGVISSIIKERNWVYVEGLNAVSRSLLVWGAMAQWLAQHSEILSWNPGFASC